MDLRKRIYQIIEPAYSSPMRNISRIYDGIMLLAIIIGVIPLLFRKQTELFYWFDVVSCGCFIIDYLLRWYTADYYHKKLKKWAFVLYPVTPMAILDLISILPTFNFVKQAFKLTRMVRLLKIVRVVKIIRYFGPLRLVMTVIKRQRVILGTVLSLAVFYVFITALIMFNAEEQINPATGKYLFDSFFDAFYWASCTLTTVGYGDIYPISTIGRAISIISSMVGIAVIALPSGIITAGYMEEVHKKRQKANCEKNDTDATNVDEEI